MSGTGEAPTGTAAEESVDPDGETASGAATEEGVETPRGRPCPICGASMAHRHCKYVCPEHGVVYDCSDTFY